VYAPDIYIDPPVAEKGKRGVTLLEAVDTLLVPIILVALTVKVYACPLTRPAMISGELAPLAVIPLGLEVTV
jgi:hypothetical protein